MTPYGDNAMREPTRRNGCCTRRTLYCLRDSRQGARMRSWDRTYFFFFKQKTAYEIYKVTGVQTCALPISSAPAEDGPSLVPSPLSISPMAASTVQDRPGQYCAADSRYRSSQLAGRPDGTRSSDRKSVV